MDGQPRRCPRWQSPGGAPAEPRHGVLPCTGAVAGAEAVTGTEPYAARRVARAEADGAGGGREHQVVQPDLRLEALQLLGLAVGGLSIGRLTLRSLIRRRIEQRLEHRPGV